MINLGEPASIGSQPAPYAHPHRWRKQAITPTILFFPKSSRSGMSEVPETGAEESAGCAGCFARVFGNAMIPMPLGPSAIGW